MIAELSDGRELEFPDGTDPAVVQSTVKRVLGAGSETAPSSMGDTVAGLPITRLAMGVASPVIAAGQLGANIGDKIVEATGGEPVVGKFINEKLAEFEAAKQRGMKAAGNEGTDWMGLLGSLYPAGKIAGAVQQALPAATSLAGKVGVGAAQGAGIAAATPTTGGTEAPLEQKAIQTGIGAATGGALPVASSALSSIAQGAKKVGEPFLDLFRKEGPANFLRKHHEDIIGKDKVKEVADALMGAKQLVPGSQPTAAEAVAGLPAGSPIQAAQRVTAATEGGPSAEFGERLLKQAAARKIAGTTRDVLTQQMRDDALKAAGNVPSKPIIQGIKATLSQPGTRASDVAQKTLTDIQEKLTELGGKKGVIDARDLYTVRKEIGNTIQKNAKDTANWDKRLSAGLERDIQKHIDDAIEQAGGTGWKAYLSEYSSRTKAISDDIARAKAALKPIQKTNLSTGVNVAREVAPALPSILSRPVVVANWALSHLGKQNIEPKIDQLAAQMYLNPQQLGRSLLPPSNVPSRTQAIIDALMQRAPMAGATAASRQY